MSSKFNFSTIALLIYVLTSSGVCLKMDDTIRNELLIMHNVVRKAVNYGLIPNQPEAKGMGLLKWNMFLEQSAQNLSDQCLLGHDNPDGRRRPEFGYVGQSWSATFSVRNGFQMWFNEMENFNFSSNSCRPNKMCGHYTQLVWENTTDVGCGLSECPKSEYKIRLVCNYGPGGNVGSRKPYQPLICG